ncbi:MAG: hypothetical protein ACTSXE_02630 [Candidatus Thorarchaeota archaeon]
MKFIAIDDYGEGMQIAEASDLPSMSKKLVTLLTVEPGEGRPSFHFSEIRVYELVEISSCLSVSLST